MEFLARKGVWRIISYFVIKMIRWDFLDIPCKRMRWHEQSTTDVVNYFIGTKSIRSQCALQLWCISGTIKRSPYVCCYAGIYLSDVLNCVKESQKKYICMFAIVYLIFRWCTYLKSYIYIYNVKSDRIRDTRCNDHQMPKYSTISEIIKNLNAFAHAWCRHIAPPCLLSIYMYMLPPCV